MRQTGLFERLLANSVESDLYRYDGCSCWEWTGRIRHAYPYMSVRIDGKKNPQGFRAHRVMAEIVIGRPLDPTLETIEHACEIPWCINYWHFNLATNSENRRDAAARRAGKPRLDLKPLLDRELYIFDIFNRSLPTLRSSLTTECPF